MKIMPIRAANASSVNLVKYLTMAEISKATISRQKKLDHSPIQSRKVM